MSNLTGSCDQEKNTSHVRLDASMPFDCSGGGTSNIRMFGEWLRRMPARSFLRTAPAYGLNFGAIDLIVDPDGEFFFLELNPNGQWAWIQQATGRRIREELCRGLTEPTESADHVP